MSILSFTSSAIQRGSFFWFLVWFCTCSLIYFIIVLGWVEGVSLFFIHSLVGRGDISIVIHSCSFRDYHHMPYVIIGYHSAISDDAPARAQALVRGGACTSRSPLLI